jgi:hypothetical protein
MMVANDSLRANWPAVHDPKRSDGREESSLRTLMSGDIGKVGGNRRRRVKTVSAALAIACVLWGAPAAAGSLWIELLDHAKHHIEVQGPDADTAQFISVAGEVAWQDRENLFKLTAKYLDSDDPRLVAGAWAVLYRLRAYHPPEWLGGKSFEEVHADYFNAIDDVGFGRVAHALALDDEGVFRSLALYLGASKTQASHDFLVKVIRQARDNGQAAIALTWHKNPADMEILLPLMLADIPVASSLPYHFRLAYGEAALPHLRRARSEALGRFTREEAAEELRTLEGS